MSFFRSVDRSPAVLSARHPSLLPEFLRDPVFLFASFLLVLNCLVLRRHFSQQVPFFAGYWNDLLLIPVALPPVLWLQTFLGWRPRSSLPSLGEIVFHLAIWSLALEGIFPAIFHRGTSDPLDLLAYAAGAAASALAWRIRFPFRASDRSPSAERL